MWDEIVNLAIKNGLWAVLFLGLFVFVIKDSKSREKKYHQIIKDLTEHLGIVKEIKEDVDEIKDVVFINKKPTKKYKNTQKNSKKAQKNTKNEKNFDNLVFKTITPNDVKKDGNNE